MSTVTQRLRDEHEELLPRLEHIRALADQIQERFDPERVDRVARIHGFLAADLRHRQQPPGQRTAPPALRADALRPLAGGRSDLP